MKKNNFLLVLTALIWGCAFVAQSVGVEYVGPFTMNSVRTILGGLTLLPVIFVLDRIKNKEKSTETISEEDRKKERKILLLGGVCCGCLLAVASSVQQIGIMYTSAGKAGFITALYILIVPILGLVIGKKVGIKVWIGVGLAAVGMYCLCITDGFSIGMGDVLVLICAVVFSFHILAIDYFAPKVDGVKMACIQFWVCGILCAVPMYLTEEPQISQILAAWMPIAYAGVLSCGVAYTLQIVAQKNVEPTVASLLLSLESVFAVLAGAVILHERLSIKETIGCVLVFIAIILAQLPEKINKNK